MSTMITTHVSVGPKTHTTKGLRHITIRENTVCESMDTKFIDVRHIAGKTNLAIIFTKDLKNMSLFLKMQDLILHDPLYRY